MDTHAVFTATVLAAIVGTLVMAVYAKKPFGLAPGMGLNAFFVFTVCLTMGYSWQMALTAVLIEGFIFIILSATGIRSMMVDAIPASLKRAIGAGIGLFIAFIGLKNAGIVAANKATFVTIGKITEGSALLGVIGIILTSVLVIKKVPGNLLIGILATTLIGIPMGITEIHGLVDGHLRFRLSSASLISPTSSPSIWWSSSSPSSSSICLIRWARSWASAPKRA